MRSTSLSLLVLFAGGCCDELGACPQNAAMVVVTADGQSVSATIEGYDFECTAGDGMAVCTTASIADGDYDLVVHADGYDPQPITLSVRTNQAPPYSCECEIPTGSVTLELAPPDELPDAGAPDSGAADAG